MKKTNIFKISVVSDRDFNYKKYFNDNFKLHASHKYDFEILLEDNPQNIYDTIKKLNTDFPDGNILVDLNLNCIQIEDLKYEDED